MPDLLCKHDILQEFGLRLLAKTTDENIKLWFQDRMSHNGFYSMMRQIKLRRLEGKMLISRSGERGGNHAAE